MTNTDKKAEAMTRVTGLARELSQALAAADQVGIDIVVSYSEVKIRDKRLKQVLAHVQIEPRD